MALSKQSIEKLLDLVEIKLGCMQVLDRDDARELTHLEACRRQLMVMKTDSKGSRASRVLAREHEHQAVSN